MNNFQSYYDILGVSPEADDEEIHLAYKQKALQFHPDRNRHNPAFYEPRFRLINEAYARLKDKEKRARYDRSLRPPNDNTEEAQNSWRTTLTRLLRRKQKTRNYSA